MSRTGGPLNPAQKLGKKFLNPIPTSVMRPGGMLRMMQRMLWEKRHGDPDESLGPFHTDTAIYTQASRYGLRVTWMGHSSLLLEMDGYRVLTDPVWSDRASCVSFAGPKRFFAPTLGVRDLPPLDVVLLSHDHYDHLDRATVQHLAAINASRPLRWVCSLGIGRYLKLWGVPKQKITETNWGQKVPVGETLQIIATPARHFSGRALWGKNETLWSSFVLQGNCHKIFFGADSGFFPGFDQIGNTYGPFDLTMLEIGAYDADWPDIHMGPQKAAAAHLALRGKLLLPIHWGLFNLAFHPWREPIERLIQIAEQKNLQLFLPRPGCPTEVTGASLHTFWWDVPTHEFQHNQYGLDSINTVRQRYLSTNNPIIRDQRRVAADAGGSKKCLEFYKEKQSRS